MVSPNKSQNSPRLHSNLARNDAKYTVSRNPNAEIGYVALILTSIHRAVQTKNGRMWSSAARVPLEIPLHVGEEGVPRRPSPLRCSLLLQGIPSGWPPNLPRGDTTSSTPGVTPTWVKPPLHLLLHTWDAPRGDKRPDVPRIMPPRSLDTLWRLWRVLSTPPAGFFRSRLGSSSCGFCVRWSPHGSFTSPDRCVLFRSSPQ